MKFAVIADVHVGNHQGVKGGTYELTMNERCRKVIACLRAARLTAEDQGCVRLYIAGDLFDNEKPTPQMIAAVADALGLADSSRAEVYALLGNHDRVSALPGDHALGWLGFSELGKVVTVPEFVVTGDGPHYMVPFQIGDSHDYLAKTLGALHTEELAAHPNWEFANRVLFVHMGIRDAIVAAANPWAAVAEDAIDVEKLFALCHEYRIAKVFAGNWHTHSQWTQQWADGFACTVTQVGALVPTGWDNPGATGYGGLSIYDYGTVSRIEIPGPRFLTVGSAAELAALPSDGANNYVRYRCLPDDVNAVSQLCDAAVSAGQIAVWSATVDVESAKRAALAGARTASDAHTLHTALESYVAAIEVPAGVDRARVLQLCTGALGLSSEGVVP